MLMHAGLVLTYMQQDLDGIMLRLKILPVPRLLAKVMPSPKAAINIPPNPIVRQYAKGPYVRSSA